MFSHVSSPIHATALRQQWKSSCPSHSCMLTNIPVWAAGSFMYLCCSVMYEEFPLSLFRRSKKTEPRHHKQPHTSGQVTSSHAWQCCRQPCLWISGICAYVTTWLCVFDPMTLYFCFFLSPFSFQAQRVCGERGHAGRPEAAVCAGLHTHGQSVEAGLRGTVVVHGIREKVSNASPTSTPPPPFPPQFVSISPLQGWKPLAACTDTPIFTCGGWRALLAGAKH